MEKRRYWLYSMACKWREYISFTWRDWYITADEIESGKKIIIENQLEKTDHSHLGPLLTYASSFDAPIIVWVAVNIRDEHKQAIEWFNRNMTENISFFLVKIEVWKIGNSKHFD